MKKHIETFIYKVYSTFVYFVHVKSQKSQRFYLHTQDKHKRNIHTSTIL